MNERELEIRKAREKLLQFEEETRTLSVNAEKIRNEKDFLMSELKNMQFMYDDLNMKFKDQQRLLQSVSSHTKNQAISGLNYLNNEMVQDGQHMSVPDKAAEEAQRADRIAR